MSVNIGRSNDDVSFRYKMPKLVTKIEGRGNGIKTVIVNMVDVAKALHCDPAWSTKYFGMELGAQSKFDPKTDRAIVNGAHQCGDLCKLLDKFIATFILCPKCHLPELKHDIKKDKLLIDCMACGLNGPLPTAHKLASFIVKMNDAAAVGKKKKKNGSKEKEKHDKQDDITDQTDDNLDGVPVAKKDKKTKIEKTEEKDKKKKQPKAETDGDDAPQSAAAVPAEPKKKKKKAKSVAAAASADDGDDVVVIGAATAGEDGKVTWFTDTSPEAQRARQEAEFAEVKKAADALTTRLASVHVNTANGNGKEDSPVMTLKLFLASGTRTPDDVAGELRRLVVSRGLDEQQRMRLAIDALFDTVVATGSEKAVIASVETNTELLRKLVATVGAAAAAAAIGNGTSTGQRLLLSNVGQLLSGRLVKSAPFVVRHLYEKDVLEADSIVSWAESPETVADVRNKVAPLVEFLKAEDDDEE